MAAYQIIGGEPLVGSIHIQGSKNAALPVIAASLLHRGTTIFYGCPNITDVRYMIRILRSLGCLVEWDEDRLSINASDIEIKGLDGECIGKMRSSILLIGALLGRCQEFTLEYPGGCSIGARPIDMHLNAFMKMGVSVDEKNESICCSCLKLKGERIVLPYPSVGATENIMMAAVNADGTTWIYNAAMEPEIVDLACFLKKMGADIHGEGTSCICIRGGCTLKDSKYGIMSDRIVAGTYLLAAAGTCGCVNIQGVNDIHLRPVLHICESMGCDIRVRGESICLKAPSRLKAVADIHTRPYPGVPTDLQSLLMAVLTKAQGATCIYEHVFEDRFRTAEELKKMGADIYIRDHCAYIRGVDKLTGASVRAMDLRGGAALIVAGLMAEGKTVVENAFYVERGYQDICRDFCSLGAAIEIINN